MNADFIYVRLTVSWTENRVGEKTPHAKHSLNTLPRDVLHCVIFPVAAIGPSKQYSWRNLGGSRTIPAAVVSVLPRQ